MQLFGKDLDRDVVVVAEVGVNHEGSIDAALDLVRLAARAGADAVKLQSYTPERYASASDPARLERVRRFALGEEAHQRLIDEAASLGIPLFSTPLSEDWVPFLAERCPAIKIASGDIDFEPVVRRAAASGRPVLLSTGLATVEEVDRAVGWVQDELGGAPLRERLVLLHCISAYPTELADASLRTIPFLAERYDVHVGWSNHVLGPAACIAAVAIGAPVVEVHVTDQTEGREFRDHAMSFDEAGLRELVALLPQVRAAMGRPGKEPAAAELGNREAIRKGVVAARDLPAGHVLQADDLAYARPATEIPAASAGLAVGRTLGVALRAGELVPAAVLDQS